MRFTIRDLLWLTVVVGMGIGWWVDRTRQREMAQERIDSHILAVDFAFKDMDEIKPGWRKTRWLSNPIFDAEVKAAQDRRQQRRMVIP